MAEAARSGRRRRLTTAHIAVIMGVLLAASSLAAPVAVVRKQRVLQPVIVRQTTDANGSAERSVLRLGGQIGRRLEITDGFAARVPAPALARLESMLVGQLVVVVRLVGRVVG